jgi:membrane-associated phospholipid phosphatase
MLQDESKEEPAPEEQKGSPAPGCNGEVQPPSGGFLYELCGRQVEPEAALWLTGNRLCLPTLANVTQYSEPSGSAPNRPLLEPAELTALLERTRLEASDFPSTTARLDAQLTILKKMVPVRDDYPYPEGRIFRDNGEELVIAPLSRFLQLQPPPFGTIFDVVAHDAVGIGEGEVNKQRERLNRNWLIIEQPQELARAFEDETPGLFHRHALNWLLYRRPDISPPRQARIWMALDMTIYAALSAAWYYKWSSPAYGRLLRPAEYARRCQGQRLNVLYDEIVNDDGREIRTEPREPQCRAGNHQERQEGVNPGTPRHPAWPSGHSTYSAAASHLLEYLVSPDTRWLSDEELEDQIKGAKPNFSEPAWLAREFRRLADNIGQARLWAGVHWTSDHDGGQKIGRAAAEAVIAQLEMDGISPMVPMPPETLPQNTPPRPAPTQGQDTIRPAVPTREEAQLIRNLVT